MRPTSYFLALTLITPLVACSPPDSAAAPALARAQGRLAWPSAGPRYPLQQVPESLRPFSKAFLHHLELYVRRRDKPTQPDVLLGVLEPGQFDRPIWVDGLTPQAPYRVLAKAYQAWDASRSTELVEAQVDASSITDFIAGPPDSVTDLDALGGIRVVLAERSFVAQATGSLAITWGRFDDPPAAETLRQWEWPR
ncbi:MAG: hypothetical protein VKP62_00170 [Candidatus Sericytochromatia bacterium]|nr:hypothetical protein [Candidatus Sericytochromatia bacterium]